MGESQAELVSLQQLRCVVATVETGSFTGAAERLDVSQPAVAEQIRRIEALLGVELFRRVGRGVRLTEAGAAFAERVPAVLRALDDALDAVTAVRELEGGSLAFGLFATPEAYGLDRLSAAFARAHPGLSLRLVARNSSAAADRVRDGELEAALIALPIDDDGLDVQPFVRDEVVYVSANPGRTRRPVTIEALSERALILYDAQSGDRDPLRRQLAERTQRLGRRLTARVETETMVMALRLVADGIGDTYIPRAHTRTDYFPRGLSFTTFDPPVGETFAIITRRGSRRSPAMTAFIDAVVTHMRGLHPSLEVVGPPSA